MAFACRICRDKFNLSKLLTDTISNGYFIVSTQCGHLFHKKCLEAALTNQKLLHAKHGRGPLRRFCPVARCNEDIPSDDFIIEISLFSEDDQVADNDSPENALEDTEVKLLKRIQTLTTERGRLKESVEKANNEIETFHSVLEEIKFDLSDIRSFLKNDHTMKKGDLIFWVTRDGTYAPGKVLEIRKKPGENIHYAIVKLDQKTKVPGVGPYAVNRDTLILPITDLVTYKAFFKEFFDKFQAKFESIMVDLNSEMQVLSSPLGSQSSAERSASYYRSTRKFSRQSPKTSIVAPSQNVIEEIASISVESVPVPAVRKNSLPQIEAKSKIYRSKTVHYGIGNEPRRLEKCRSLSWATPPTTNSLESPTSSNFSDSSRMSLIFQELRELSFENSQDEDEEPSSGFIKEGEKVIWYDTYSEYDQIGTVAAICEFSPCAIVKFEEHPVVKHKFQYRTVSIHELFPYDLASPEDKFRIAEIYGQIDEFVKSREHLFSIENEDSPSDGEEEKLETENDVVESNM